MRSFLGLAADAPARLHRRAQDRRAVAVAALRGRPAGPGRHPRRRRDGRERHRQRPHHRRHPRPARRRARRAGGARRGLHEPRRFRRAQRPPGRGGRQDLRQPAQRRRRLAAPARRRDHPRPAAALLRLCLGRAVRAAGRDPDGGASSGSARSGFVDQPADHALRRARRDAGASTREIEASARRSATTSTAWSTRSTTSRCSAGSASARPRRAGPSRTSSRPSWPGPGSRRSTSRSAAPARSARWRGCTPVTVGGVVVSNATLHNEDYIAGRDATGDADPRRQGHPRRRLGAGLPRRRRDPQGRRRGPVAAARPRRVALRLPDTCARNAAREAIREEGDAVRRCTGGLICPAQAVEKLKHFVSRAAFDIEGLGAKQVEQFYPTTAGSASRPTSSPCAPRYGSGIQQLKNREGWGEKARRTSSTRSRSKRSIPLQPADLRARHPPCRRGRRARPRAPLRHLGGVDRRGRRRRAGGRAPPRRRGRAGRPSAGPPPTKAAAPGSSRRPTRSGPPTRRSRPRRAPPGTISSASTGSARRVAAVARHQPGPGGRARLDRPAGGPSDVAGGRAPRPGRKPGRRQDRGLHRHAGEDDPRRGQGAGRGAGRQGRRARSRPRPTFWSPGRARGRRRRRRRSWASR